MHLVPEPAPISLRVHTRVKNDKETGEKTGRLHDQWANFAMVLDCETTIDIRQDLNFLWWRFCELKNESYVCQQEGLVYADILSQESVDLIRAFARSKRAEVEDGCPEEIVVESRTQFVNGKFWKTLQAGAVVVCFNGKRLTNTHVQVELFESESIFALASLSRHQRWRGMPEV